MSSISNAAFAVTRWGWVEDLAAVVAVVTLAWWLLFRHAVAAMLAAVGLTLLAGSPAVRVLASQSHLIAMMTLELTVVVAPLLVLAAMGTPPTHRSGGPSPAAAMASVGTALLYAGGLIAIHLPTVQRRSAGLGAVPVWVPIVALMIGVAYWSTLLRSAGRVPARIRLATLFSAQEVAAFICLLSLFGAWGHMSPMARTNPLGISMAWDQRFGGALMMATCAIVTIPIARRIGRSPNGGESHRPHFVTDSGGPERRDSQHPAGPGSGGR
jgi:hypothetical protein